MQKEQSIETLRGLAVILMVTGHVIGHDKYSGLRVDDDSVYRYLYFSLAFLRMPLFTAISGYVYGLKPLHTGNLKKFIGGKARRLLFPLFTVGTIQYLLKTVIPGINHPAILSGIWKIYIYPFDQFWFLQAIFIVFATIALLEYYNLMNSLKRWLIVLAGTILFVLFLPKFTSVFSFQGYLYLLPFFILGLGIKRFEKYIFTSRYIPFYIMILIIGIFIQQLTWYKNYDLNVERTSSISIISGFAGITLLFYTRKHLPLLSHVGYYSYAIYLFHIFSTAGTRLLLKGWIGVYNTMALFTIDLIAGITLPIIAERLIMTNKYFKTAFLGLRFKGTDHYFSFFEKFIPQKVYFTRIFNKS